ncbi:MAG TPA: 30S ribosomal protein S16 [Longimicrobiales bacterium]
MSVRIRLRRVGRKKQPSYRIVVAESTAPRDGAYVDSVGFYDPRRQPAELVLDLEKVDYWLARGAQPTETAASLIRKARRGGDRSVKLVQRAAAPAASGATAAPSRAAAAPSGAAAEASGAAEAPASAAEAQPQAATEPGSGVEAAE